MTHVSNPCILRKQTLNQMLLLHEVLRPKGRTIKASPQAWRYCSPDRQAALQRMLSEWADFQRIK